MLGLYLFNAVLFTRLFLLFRDEAVSLRYVGATWILQMALLLPLAPSIGVALLALALAIANGLWFWAERRMPTRLYMIRLTVLVVLVILLGIFLAPGVGLAFRASLSAIPGDSSRYFAFADLAGSLDWRRIHTYMLGILLCVSEANILVRVVIENFNLRPMDGGHAGDESVGASSNEYKRGRVIGLLERLILFYLVLGGQYGALGFVIAAKTMARFKNLEDRNFAEYFLVGTLLSLMAAGAVALFTNWLLALAPSA